MYDGFLRLARLTTVTTAKMPAANSAKSLCMFMLFSSFCVPSNFSLRVATSFCKEFFQTPLWNIPETMHHILF